MTNKNAIESVASNRSFDGWHKQFMHQSQVLNCKMRFAIYLPPAAEQQKVPVLYWLSGLTCTDENFMQKAGAQKLAAKLGIAIVAPDTSPRGEGVADDPEGVYDLGLGAGFYINATREPWAQHYQMESYITEELPALIEANFPVSSQKAIAGHSMGGHGAITLALKYPDLYCSVSAFSPIANPSDCPWGHKAFTAYLGGDQQLWQQYDASCLLREATDAQKLPLLVDQGLADSFLEQQLKSTALEAAAESSGYPLKLRYHEGYDHSYYFIASFIDEHLEFHARYLK